MVKIKEKKIIKWIRKERIQIFLHNIILEEVRDKKIKRKIRKNKNTREN